jgi:hypothetical protein
MSQWSAPWNAPKVQVDTVIEPVVEAVAPTQTTTPEPEVKAAPAKEPVKKSETPAEEE